MDKVYLFKIKNWNETKNLVSFKERKKLISAEDEYKKLVEETADYLHKKCIKKNKDLSEKKIIQLAENPLYQAGYLLKKKYVSSVVAGSQYTSSEVIRAALFTIGLSQGFNSLSGSFLLTKSLAKMQAEYFLFTDCAVTIEPSLNQLVEIAEQALLFWQKCIQNQCNFKAKMAFLSFSTQGSAQHPNAEIMAKACKLFRDKYPEIQADGELQFDAAIDSTVRKQKTKSSNLIENANIFIFPNLAAANISYKIAQRWAGLSASGPFLQGLARPYSDISRGASSEDIVTTSIFSLLQAEL